jgi:hypothetical protein
MDNSLIRGALFGVVLSACGGGAPETTCGPGTQLENGQCTVAQMDTSPLTALQHGSNVAFSDGVRLGNFIGGLFYARRLVLTHLSNQSAQAWTTDGTALIGKGPALMISGAQTIDEYASYDAPLATLTIDGCSTATDLTAYPEDELGNPKDGKAYGALYDWDLGTPTKSICITSGLVSVDYQGGVTVTAQFDDGTTWSDQRFTVGAAASQ